LTRWPSYVRDRHAAITYTTPRDAPKAKWFERNGCHPVRHKVQPSDLDRRSERKGHRCALRLDTRKRRCGCAW
ncbi:IS256 family transposase, partial [Mycobacterium avium subsp. hominissuis]|nr:IS256 family transposase [Mycobacterium avium subsp. hominissuis]